MATESEPIRIVQLSDTHFLEPGESAEGGFAYDTDEAFDAVFARVDELAASAGQADLVVVTGDVADHGRPGEYRRAAEAFARFDPPVNVCPGNHDLDAVFTGHLGRPGVSTSRVVRAGRWAFLFADSNAGGMVLDPAGRLVDPDDPEIRLHRNGTLGAREMSWLIEAGTTTDAEHVFVWVHHPPDVPIPMSHDAAYADEWAEVLAAVPKIRGIGAGHTHVPDDYVLDGRTVFVAPALKHCFDLSAETWLPPGLRTYRFNDDGSIESEVHLVDDDRWPRRPMGRALMSLFAGELTFDDLAEIIARRQSS